MRGNKKSVAKSVSKILSDKYTRAVTCADESTTKNVKKHLDSVKKSKGTIIATETFKQLQREKL